MRTSQENWQLQTLHALTGAQSAAPFFKHHAAFANDLGRIERDVRGNIGQKLEALVKKSRAIGRNGQNVNRFVEAGARVQVRAKSHTNRLEIFHDIIFREMCGAVKRHVLNEVRQAALILIFQHGTGIDHQPQFHAFFGLGVFADVVAQSVGQCAGLDRGIDR